MKFLKRRYLLITSLLVALFVVVPVIAINSNGLINGLGEGRNRHRKTTTTPAPVEPTPTTTPTPKPNPIPHGTKGFSVSSNNPGPTMGRGTIDPYDPEIGSSQSIYIEVFDTAYPVTSVNITLQTDHESNTHPMTLTSGTTGNGTWSANWVVSDTYNYTYKATLTAVSASGTNSVSITLR